MPKLTKFIKRNITLEFLGFCMTRHLHDGRESCHVGKKVTYFGEFDHLNSLCIRKSIILTFLSSSRDKFTQTSRTDVSFDFGRPRWSPSGWAQAWRLHIHRMQIWRTTRSAPRTSCLKLRLVRPQCFVLTMLPLKNLASWTI